MTCVYHYGVTQSVFTALNIFCGLMNFYKMRILLQSAFRLKNNVTSPRVTANLIFNFIDQFFLFLLYMTGPIEFALQSLTAFILLFNICDIYLCYVYSCNLFVLIAINFRQFAPCTLTRNVKAYLMLFGRTKTIRQLENLSSSVIA